MVLLTALSWEIAMVIRAPRMEGSDVPIFLHVFTVFLWVVGASEMEVFGYCGILAFTLA